MGANYFLLEQTPFQKEGKTFLKSCLPLKCTPQSKVRLTLNLCLKPFMPNGIVYFKYLNRPFPSKGSLDTFFMITMFHRNSFIQCSVGPDQTPRSGSILFAFYGTLAINGLSISSYALVIMLWYRFSMSSTRL